MFVSEGGTRRLNVQGMPVASAVDDCAQAIEDTREAKET